MTVLGSTAVFGIFGDPVSHSLSPVMHNAAFTELQLDAIYVPFHVVPTQLESAVNSIRSLGISGVNVTVPHKEAVLPFLDRVDPIAQRIGAVNTIVNQDGTLAGYNTDGHGFIQALAEDLSFSPKDKSALILGAGGASRAAVFSLAQQGARQIFIANRTLAKAKALSDAVFRAFPQTQMTALGLDPNELARVVERVDVIANSISAGLKGEAYSDFPWQKVSAGTGFFDMVYSPAETAMVKLARRQGLTAVDGLGMLAGQGEEAFRLWTGQNPPKCLMRQQLQFRRTQTS